MTTTTDVLTSLREDLIAAGLVRRPTEAAPAGAPPCHIEPADGAPAPGEAPEGTIDDATLVVSIMASGDLGETPEDSYRRRSIVDVRYRSRTNAGLIRAAMLDAAIRARLTGVARFYGRGFTLDDGTYVLEAQQYAGFGPIDRRRDGGTALFTHGAKYALEVRA